MITDINLRDIHDYTSMVGLLSGASTNHVTVNGGLENLQELELSGWISEITRMGMSQQENLGLPQEVPLPWGEPPLPGGEPLENRLENEIWKKVVSSSPDSHCHLGKSPWKPR